MNERFSEQIDVTTRVVAIERRLRECYPDRAPLLHYRTPFELAISVILSAQTTDEQVNRVTPELFTLYPDPATLGAAPLTDVERIVHSTGFFRAKARNIVAAAAAIHERFGDELPSTIEELVTIPGMGRKSANVIVGVIFGAPSIVVDTHLSRVTNRLGLVNGTNPQKIERELKALVPQEIQSDFSMEVNLHGRYRCHARKPECGACEIFALCMWEERGGYATEA